MAEIVVVAPANFDIADGIPVVRYETAVDVLAALAARGDVVLVSDALAAAELEAIAATARTRMGQTIEVRSERWDGETQSPLSAACRGVISGFGASGVARAVEVLRGN